jgi:hypothetical protein
LNQAAEKAQQKAQQNAEAVERATHAQEVARQHNTSALDTQEEEEEEKEDDYKAEIDLQEEENLEEYQNQPYLYCVSFVLKTLLGNSPSKHVKWQGKVGTDD